MRDAGTDFDGRRVSVGATAAAAAAVAQGVQLIRSQSAVRQCWHFARALRSTGTFRGQCSAKRLEYVQRHERLALAFDGETSRKTTENTVHAHVCCTGRHSEWGKKKTRPLISPAKECVTG